MQTLQEEINNYIFNRKTVSPYDLVNDLLPKYYPVNDLVIDADQGFRVNRVPATFPLSGPIQSPILTGVIFTRL